MDIKSLKLCNDMTNKIHAIISDGIKSTVEHSDGNYDYSMLADYKTDPILKKMFYGTKCVCETSVTCLIMSPIKCKICSYCAFNKFNNHIGAEMVCMKQELLLKSNNESSDFIKTYIYITNYGKKIVINETIYKNKYKPNEINIISFSEHKFWISIDYINIINICLTSSESIIDIDSVLKYMEDINTDNTYILNISKFENDKKEFIEKYQQEIDTLKKYREEFIIIKEAYDMKEKELYEKFKKLSDIIHNKQVDKPTRNTCF